MTEMLLDVDLDLFILMKIHSLSKGKGKSLILLGGVVVKIVYNGPITSRPVFATTS